jgi:hypothetical protein
MNDNPLISFHTFCALQLARIHRNLYPEHTNPVHVRGPRKPDMQEQEKSSRT